MMGNSGNREFFVALSSFAAPFFSDLDTIYVEAQTAVEAIESARATYHHPAGLYAARAYDNADAYLKAESEPAAEWLCNHEIAARELKPASGGYSFLGDGPGDFEINGVRHTIVDPKGGRITRPSAI